MKFYYVLVFVSCVWMVATSVAEAQVKNQPYSYQHYQKYDELLYSPNTRMHTATKPFLFKGDLLTKYDSIQSLNQVDSDNLFLRKIFNEHLVDIQKEDHSFYLDFLPDFVIGKEMIGADKRTTWLNTRGVQLGLNIKDKFTFYANAFENQGVFPNYLTDYIDRAGVIPGQGHVKDLAGNKKDWMYATANLSYDFSDYFQATLAYDKNHIGDGYRSLLLSDFSSNYAHLKFTGKIGNVQYTSIWAYMNDPRNPRIDSLNSGGRFGDGSKWGAFQYLDYNATNRLSVGFFQAVVWANRNEAGHRGFDFNYANPIIFLRPVESNNSTSPDKMFLGLNAKYKVLDNMTAYGQFLLGEFTAKEFFAGNGYAHNKWGTQLGVKGFNIFKVQNLNFIAEYNVVRPYTYQHFVSISNYSNNGEPLAHPRGANFRELLGMVNYSWNRFDFSIQGLYSRYGTDPDHLTNMGGDIFQSYRTIPNMHGNYIGQGVKNDLYYADVKAAYVLNPKYNLRFEVGYTQRYNQIAESPTEKSGVISFGLRSSFRNFYGDI
ncbi:gliding motility protein RemB [Sphingobacterium sp. DN00404]|uniref:Gliding motility protein RemB n=1 Tax=Sphingobacterium micropteri TaxID=2763501 RepID=A0ABR7YK24_9SPHI|nr:gliding motility protein RemB [Sphingobacterium micropteri]MBD1431685.1 gliding motility protein RemB [Sphingobacterium micropteri]